MKNRPLPKWYIGMKDMIPKLFKSRKVITTKTNPEFDSIIGPFKNKRAACLMMGPSPFKEVKDAERFSRRHYRIEKKPLNVGCDSCRITYIQGIRCHEQRCLESWRDDTRKCRWCGQNYKPKTRFQDTCDENCHLAFHH